ncbi:NAD(P)-binding protein [Thauera sp. 63]|uniref:NAD(P)-binding protein n=1 Tax=Thauera sp. 63 TaxID=497321 RepID=UPI0002D0A8EB|nr:NAD(P)-binding protein [Thauera sp. 63]ENO75364.1 FAD-dependent pyridine nucleotide-disulfide oxidoreductase [Thauera sp. 63]
MSHTPAPPCVAPDVDETRRRLLFGASALPVVAGAGLSIGPQSAQASLKTSARIVIAGSGLGGLAIASRLSRELDGAKITIIDRTTSPATPSWRPASGR